MIVSELSFKFYKNLVLTIAVHTVRECRNPVLSQSRSGRPCKYKKIRKELLSQSSKKRLLL